MKILIATFAVTLALAFTGPAFAGNVKAAKTESDCRMADGHWDKMNKRCHEKRCKPNRCFERYEGASASVGALLVPCGNRACMAGLSYPRL